MFGGDFEHALGVMDGALDHLALHRRNGALILDYNDVLDTPGRQISRIADHLARPLPPAALEAIREEMSLPRMRDKAPLAEDADIAGLIRHETGLYDPRTLLNVGHIRDGRPGGGARMLNAAQMAQVARLVRRRGLVADQSDA